jgi:hypothetical protein
LKAKRWVEGRLDGRLGLPAGSFGPLAKEGEFLSNLTAALRDLLGRKPASQYLGSMSETVEWETPKGLRSAVVNTHLARLKSIPGLPEQVLLIYEIVQYGRSRLVTAFPVDEAYAAAIAATPASPGGEFKPRFNLHIDPAWRVRSYRSAGFKPAS